MPKGVLACIFVTVLGCAEQRPAIVARVNDRVLPVSRLAELMVLAQPVPLTPDAGYELASHWVTLTAFAQQMATGDSLLDSASILDLMGERVRQTVAAEWRRRLLARVGGEGSRRAARFDSTYARELLSRKRAALLPGAAAIVRQIALDPWRAWDSALVLAGFTGGAIGADQIAHFVQYLSPVTRREMSQASDDRIADFLLGLTLEELLRRQADSAGFGLSDSAYRALARECRDVIHALWERAGLAPAALAPAGASPAERARAAALRVEQYLDAASARRVTLEPLPPFLAVSLLRAVHWEIRSEQVDAALEQARRLLAATGSGPASAKP